MTGHQRPPWGVWEESVGQHVWRERKKGSLHPSHEMKHRGVSHISRIYILRGNLDGGH